MTKGRFPEEKNVFFWALKVILGLKILYNLKTRLLLLVKNALLEEGAKKIWAGSSPPHSGNMLEKPKNQFSRFHCDRCEKFDGNDGGDDDDFVPQNFTSSVPSLLLYGL